MGGSIVKPVPCNWGGGTRGKREEGRGRGNAGGGGGALAAALGHEEHASLPERPAYSPEPRHPPCSQLLNVRLPCVEELASDRVVPFPSPLPLRSSFVPSCALLEFSRPHLLVRRLDANVYIPTIISSTRHDPSLCSTAVILCRHSSRTAVQQER